MIYFQLTLRRLHRQVNIQIRTVFTDTENGEFIADLDFPLQKIQESTVVLAEEIISGQFDNLQSHAIIDRGVREDQKLDGDLGDHIRVSSIVAGDAQRIADCCTHTIKILINKIFY